MADPTVMELASNALRGMIVAPPGRKLVVSDLSNIEGRILPWLAGEEWKLTAFREFDAGTGIDLYLLAYARAFGIPVGSVTEAQRQIGKVMELSMGYEGGVGAFVTMAATYNLDLVELAAAVLASDIPRHVRMQANSFWGWASLNRKTLGLDQNIFIACDILKRLWREAHPAITAYWPAVKSAATAAILNPNETFPAGRLAYRREGAWLLGILPSGRYLCYPSPKAEMHGNDYQLSYMGMNQYSRKWQRLKTYGGKSVEQGDQGTARDVMAEAMPKAEEAGYQIILTVHDELVTEAPDTEEFSAKGLSAILSAGADWTAELPLAAKGYEAYRYRKG